MPRLTPSRLVAVGATFLALGGVSVAAIPSSGGQITGCVTGDSALRVVDGAKGQTCSDRETPLTWNVAGPEGPKGPAGPAGAPGPLMPGDYAEHANAVNVGNGMQQVAFTELVLPQQARIMAEATFEMSYSGYSPGPQNTANCRIYVDGEPAGMPTGVSFPAIATTPRGDVMASVVKPAGTHTVALRCDGSSGVSVSKRRLMSFATAG